MPKDFITFLDYSREEIEALLDLTDRMHEAHHTHTIPQVLAGKSVALVWDGEGFRNRVAFELGIALMGGIAVQVPGRLDERESIEDVTAYLNNWVDAIVARAKLHSHMLRLAATAEIPVINARTDYNHPCEILGDLAYIRASRARRGSLDGLKVAFFGEAANICHPWLEAAARLPIRVVQICPEGYSVDPTVLAGMQRGAVGELSTTHDWAAGLSDADVICTDCWPRCADADERGRIEALFTPYQVTAERLSMASPNVMFLPCPPVHRGEEVSANAMASPACCVYAAKEYLLHAQNAVLSTLLSSNEGDRKSSRFSAPAAG